MVFQPEQFANKAQSSLAAGIGTGDVAITLASAAGFPLVGKFRLLISDLTQYEIVLCTAASGVTFTITRAQEGTTAKTFAAGATVTAAVTVGSLLNTPLGMTTAFDEPYLDANGNQARLAANTSTTLKVKTSQGDGTNPAAPGWTNQASLSVGHATTASTATSATTAATATLATTASYATIAAPGAGAQPSVKVSGTNPAQTTGNLRLTELTTVSKGESTGFGFPNWNSGGQNLLAFGDLFKLKSGVLLTIYTRETQEASSDGNGSLCYKTSSDFGASWSAETQLYLASANPSFPSMSDCCCWQNSGGRTFVWFNVQNNGTQQVPGKLIWTDDPLATPGTWSAPITVVDPNFSFNFYAVTNGALELNDGTMILFGYGLNTGDPQKSCTCIQSTDNGATWTRRSLITNGPVLVAEYVEPCWVVRADGSVLIALRGNTNTAINFITSSDNCLTWSAISANTLPGVGKPPMIRLADGAIVLLTRSKLTGNPSCLFVCRDGDGTQVASWGTEQDFDPRVSPAGVPFKYYYGGMAHVAPNVIACAFAGASTGTQSDWSFTYFLDGNASIPTGSAVRRDLFCNGLAVNRQTIITVPNAINHIGNSATGTQIATAMNALIDLMTTSGVGLQHPEVPGNLIGWYEPWRDPGQVIGTGAASLLDLSAAGVGNLTQATGAKKPLYEMVPWLCGGKGMLYATGVQVMQSAAFTAKAPPFTIFWAGVLPTNVGNGFQLFGISDGTTTGAVYAYNTNILYIGGGSVVPAPAFVGYPQGPTVLRAEFNGASSKLYRDGQLLVSGNIGSLPSCTLLRLGDPTNNGSTWNYHLSAYNAILPAAQAREMERYIAATFPIEAWNPR